MRVFLLQTAAVVGSIALFATWLGLAVQGGGSPPVILSAALLLTVGPWVALRLADADTERAATLQVIWAVAVFAVLPALFPGRRADALADGLAILSFETAPDSLHDAIVTNLDDPLPPDAASAVPLAREVIEAIPPPGPALGSHEIELPYEGEGRRLSVPVVFEHDGVELELYMMLDTGATYTTLPPAVLARLRASPGPDSPSLTLHTANGDRNAQVALLDRVWLGDQAIDGVAITECVDCASGEVEGLLGLNVASGFNVTIDADRRVVVFSGRKAHDRVSDMRPFVDLEAGFLRSPGGRVSLTVDLDNRAARAIEAAVVRVTCDDKEWDVDLGPVAPISLESFHRRLPRHARCESYRVSLHGGAW